MLATQNLAQKDDQYSHFTDKKSKAQQLSDMLSDLPRVTQLVSDRSRTHQLPGFTTFATISSMKGHDTQP